MRKITMSFLKLFCVFWTICSVFVLIAHPDLIPFFAKACSIEFSRTKKAVSVFVDEFSRTQTQMQDQQEEIEEKNPEN